MQRIQNGIVVRVIEHSIAWMVFVQNVVEQRI